MKYKVVKFGASWCGPCKVLEEKLKNFDKCDIIKYDVDDVDEEVIMKYKIRNVPTTIILDENDNEIHKFIGIFNISDLENKLNELENA